MSLTEGLYFIMMIALYLQPRTKPINDKITTNNIYNMQQIIKPDKEGLYRIIQFKITRQ